MLMSLSGVLIMWHGFRDLIQKNLKFLVTFAMGVFVVTLYLLFKETTHLQGSIGMIALAAASGALFLEILQRVFPEAHHHHGADETECCDHAHGKEGIPAISAHRVLFGDAIHNISDGIILVPAFLISFEVGLSITIAIMLHEVVQEISEFFILKEAGYTTKKALLSNLIVSSTIFLGIALSLLFISITEYVYILMAFAAGGILYIIMRDLLPHTIKRIKHEGKAIPHAFIFMLGVLIMLGTTHILPHSHELEGDVHDHEQHVEEESHDHDHHLEEDLHDHEDHTE